uniref:Cystatin domain-containing protein n=1 Tax=Strongyloides papillosus TaxID=174720 RepID=A0A0N5BQU2_STREA
MNYLNVSILIIGTFLIATGASFNFLKHHDNIGWQDKNTNSSKILKLAQQSVDQFNKKYKTDAKLENVISATKSYISGSKHYNLEVLTMIDCENNGKKCPERIHSDIYRNNNKDSKTVIKVYKEGVLKYR